VEVIGVPVRRGRVEFGKMIRLLGDRGITSLLIEGGGIVAASALQARAVDRVAWFVAPMLLGGDGRPAVAALGIPRVSGAIRLRGVRHTVLGDDVLIEGSLAYTPSR
jgi:diaminohydroxyphosphoribosylaminopyrimidine deaminase/5-amino-6-(5-phosphoribosylamino)uracil reductase